MSWSIETKLPVACYASTGIEYKKNIYLFGGISRKGIHKRAWVYNIKEKIWKEMKNLPNVRNYMSCHVWDENIFLLGGWGIDIEIMSVKTPQILKYSINDDSWHIESELPYPLTNIATCIHENNLYIFGGMTKKFEFTRYITVDTAFRYDLIEKKWYDFSRLPFPKKDFSAEVINNEIYIFGGCNHDNVYNDIWKYSNINKQWCLVGLLPINICSYSLIRKKGLLYLIGGMTDNFKVSKSIWNIEVNNIENVYWNKITDIPESLSYFMSVTDNESIYIMGGFNNRYISKKNVYKFDLFPWNMERQIWIGYYSNTILSKLPKEIIKLIIKFI